MTSSGGDVPPSVSKPPTSGIRTVLQYSGIPPSWFDKRPSLPSRNWLIFIGATSAIAGYYFYDRRECKRIRQEYVDRVKHLADVPLHSLDYPRKVTVYGCKWPGDEDYDRSMKHFRKYVKPILVAAAVDYEMINGRRHGDLATRIADDIRTRRRILLGLDPPPFNPMSLPNTSPEDKQRRELEGGIIIVGRPTFKEFMAGLKRGWTESLRVPDREEDLARVLESDGRFDEPEPEVMNDGPALDGEPIATPSRLPPSRPLGVFSPNIITSASKGSTKDDSSIPSELDTPPATIPPIPPLLLVSYVDHIGLTQVPLMIWEFFNERKKVKSGAEAAYKLVMGTTRPFNAPPPQSTSLDTDPSPAQPYFAELGPSDLDFDKEAESYYKPSVVRSYKSEIESAREEYYKALPAKLETARALARGTRPPTEDEEKHPPPTEVELRAERLKKELRWRNNERGWDIIRPDSNVEWDERFRGKLAVFTEPSSSSEEAVENKASA